MKKRIFAILLALTLALTLLPTAVFATGEDGAAEPQQEEVKPEVDPEQPEEPEQPEQPEQPEGQPEQPEAKPEEEKEAQEQQEEPAPQPAQSAGEPVVLNGEDETTVIEVNQTYVDTSGFTSLKGGNIYRLTGNVTIESGSLWVFEGTPEFEPAILDLNGHTLTIKNPPNANLPYYNSNGAKPSDTSPAGIIVFSNAESHARQYQLTLRDSSDAGTGVLNVQGEKAVGIYVGSNCILNIEGGTITNSTVNETTPPTGTGVKAVLGKVNMNGGSIKNQATGVKLSGGTFNMTSGTIENCTGATGGGVLAEAGYTNIKTTKASTITMTGGTIRNCNATFGGGVYVANKGTFNMSGGSIENCKASSEDGRASGGGIYNAGRTTLSGTAKIRNCQAANAGGGIYDYSILNISDNVEITGCTAPLWSAMLVSGTISGGTFNGTVTSGGTITGGTFNGEVRNVGTITGGTFNGQVTNPGRITGGTFKGGITGTPALATGSGTEDDPYQIGTAIGLEWFRDKVNAAQNKDETKICAVLTADIVLDANESWEPIGIISDYSSGQGAYTGTFDGKGHTISGLNASGNFAYAGLFGAVTGGTIKNLTVAGNVSPSNSQCIAGGIVGYASNAAIKNCSNHCSVSGGSTSIIGGIAGFSSSGAIIVDCYNVGTISGINYAAASGGIVGSNSGTISNCYNVGKVSGGDHVGEIAGDNFGTVENCYYLNATNNNAVGKNKGTITSTKSMTAAQFADGTVLKLLKADRDDSPWDSVSKVWNGMVLPGFTWQNNNHTHNWGAWTSNGDGTHSRACACGVTETVNCSGGTATCTKKAVCTACGGEYGNALGHKGGKSTCHTKAVCEVCKQEYGEVDAANHDGGTEVKNAKAATCTEKGYTGDTYCKGCNTVIKAGTEINALDHDWGKWVSNKDGTHTRVCSRDKSHTESGKCSGGKADCCHKAECTVCGGKYGNLDPDNHSDLKHFPAKRATTRAEGNIEYWYCSGCGKYYRDEEATKEITQKDTVIRKRRPSGDSTTTDDKTVKSVKTGDAGIALYVGMAALSLTGGAWLRRKKQ